MNNNRINMYANVNCLFSVYIYGKTRILIELPFLFYYRMRGAVCARRWAWRCTPEQELQFRIYTELSTDQNRQIQGWFWYTKENDSKGRYVEIRAGPY